MTGAFSAATFRDGSFCDGTFCDESFSDGSLCRCTIYKTRRIVPWNLSAEKASNPWLDVFIIHGFYCVHTFIRISPLYILLYSSMVIKYSCFIEEKSIKFRIWEICSFYFKKTPSIICCEMSIAGDTQPSFYCGGDTPIVIQRLRFCNIMLPVNRYYFQCVVSLLYV